MGEIEKSKLKKIKEALLKKAVGYYADEIVEEYSYEDGKECLTKKKITKKYVPGDMTASKMLLEFFNESGTFENMTDEELDAEMIRLFKEYQKLTNVNMLQRVLEDKPQEEQNN